MRQFGEGLPGGAGDPEPCAGLVDGGELVGRRESPVEELQGLLGCGQGSDVGAAGGRANGGRAEAGEGRGVAEAGVRLVGVAEVAEEQRLAELGRGFLAYLPARCDEGLPWSGGSGAPPGRRAAPVSGSKSTKTRPSVAQKPAPDLAYRELLWGGADVEGQVVPGADGAKGASPVQDGGGDREAVLQQGGRGH